MVNLSTNFPPRTSLASAGQLVRLDSVVSLPLRRLRDSGLPSVAEALLAIGQAL